MKLSIRIVVGGRVAQRADVGRLEQPLQARERGDELAGGVGAHHAAAARQHGGLTTTGNDNVRGDAARIGVARQRS